jgi:hypothetical protein
MTVCQSRERKRPEVPSPERTPAERVTPPFWSGANQNPKRKRGARRNDPSLALRVRMSVDLWHCLSG